MFQIKNDFRNANVARTIRFTEPLYERLMSQAQKHDVSFNLLVLQCCKYAMEDMQPEDETKPDDF